MSTGRKNQRTGQPKVGEEQLALFLIYGFSGLVEQTDRNISQGKTLHFLAAKIIRHKGNKRAPGRTNGMPHRLCHVISIAGRPGQRIGFTTSRKYNRFTAITAVFALHTGDHAIAYKQFRRPILNERDPGSAKSKEKTVDHIGGTVRNREHAVSALHFKVDAQFLKESHHLLRREGSHRAVKKLAVSKGAAQDLVCRTGIGHVAATLASDVNFAAHLGIAFHQHNIGSGTRRHQCRHHSGSTAANYDDGIGSIICYHTLPFHIPHILPRYSPICGKYRKLPAVSCGQPPQSEH